MKKVFQSLSLLFVFIVSTTPLSGMLILKQEKNNIIKNMPSLRSKKLKDTIKPEQDEEQVFETVVVVINGVRTVVSAVATGIAITAADTASRVVTGRSLRERAQGAMHDALPSEPISPRPTVSESRTTDEYVYRNETTSNNQSQVAPSIINSATNVVAGGVFNIATQIVTGKSPAQHKKDRQKKWEKYEAEERRKAEEESYWNDEWCDNDDEWDDAYRVGNRIKYKDGSPDFYLVVDAADLVDKTTNVAPDGVRTNIFVPPVHDNPNKDEGCFDEKPEEVNNTEFDPPTPDDSLNSGGCGEALIKDQKLFDAMAATDRKIGASILPYPKRSDGFKAKKIKGDQKPEKMPHPETGQYGYKAKNKYWWIPTPANGSQHPTAHWDILDEDGNKVDDVYVGGISRRTKDKTEYGSFMQAISPENSGVRGFVGEVVSNVVPTRDQTVNAFSIAISDAISYNILKRIESIPDKTDEKQMLEIREKLHRYAKRVEELKHVGATSRYPEEVKEIEKELIAISDDSLRLCALIDEAEKKRRSNYAFNQVAAMIVTAAVDVFIGDPIRKRFGSRFGEE